VKVWPGATVFPDYTNPNATEWWTNMAASFHEIIPYDGIWLVLIFILLFS
jgi:alpha-glucosidase (family GH31 glycosyl hydrolase)